jgi:hypothetical protein
MGKRRRVKDGKRGRVGGKGEGYGREKGKG